MKMLDPVPIIQTKEELLKDLELRLIFLAKLESGELEDTQENSNVAEKYQQEISEIEEKLKRLLDAKKSVYYFND